MTIRLLKVVCQAVLVDDADGTLREIVAEPIAVSAAELDAYPARVEAELAALNAGPTLANEVVALEPNRAARRDKAKTNGHP